MKRLFSIVALLLVVALSVGCSTDGTERGEAVLENLQSMVVDELALTLNRGSEATLDSAEQKRRGAILSDALPRESINALLDRAKGGDAKAQLQLADRYFHGVDTDIDFREAKLWYTMAAEQGNVEAQYHLANILYYGLVADRDKEAALALFEQAANAGLIHAQQRLVLLYTLNNEMDKGSKWQAQLDSQEDVASRVERELLCPCDCSIVNRYREELYRQERSNAHASRAIMLFILKGCAALLALYILRRIVQFFSERAKSKGESKEK